MGLLDAWLFFLLFLLFLLFLFFFLFLFVSLEQHKLVFKQFFFDFFINFLNSPEGMKLFQQIIIDKGLLLGLASVSEQIHKQFADQLAQSWK
jgi:hypothetical protein